MSRDYVGYGEHPPKMFLPGNSQIALNFVINYEEGSERNILDGDAESESYLTDWPLMAAQKNMRSLSSESLFEYGSRVGIWRLLTLFNRYKIPLTFFATGLALERNPELCKKLGKSHHEIAGHGYRWIDYRQVDVNKEREDIQKTLSVIKIMTGKNAIGWYTGRCSENTRKLIIEAGLKYDSDSYFDDLPYIVKEGEVSHLVIPYALDTNDARFGISPGFNSGSEFFEYLKSSFDYLYKEGNDCPKMMTVGLHPRFSGRSGRCFWLEKFIEYVLSIEKVWICRREDIAALFQKR